MRDIKVEEKERELVIIEGFIERNHKLQRHESTTDAEKQALISDALYLLRARSDLQIEIETEKTEQKIAEVPDEIQKLVDTIGDLLGEPKFV